MCAHDMKDAGVNKSSKILWNGTNLYVLLILYMEPIKLLSINSVELESNIKLN